MTYHLLLVAILATTLGVEVVNILGFSTVTVGLYQYLFMALAVSLTFPIFSDGPGFFLRKNPQVRPNPAVATLSGGRLPAPYRASALVPGEASDESERTAGAISLDKKSFALFALVAVAATYLLSQISLTFFADLLYSRGKLQNKANNPGQALLPLANAVNLNPNQPVFRIELAQTEALLALVSSANQDQSSAGSYKNESVRNFDIVRNQNPWHLTFLRTESNLIFALGEIEEKLYDKGIRLAQAAARLAPTDPRGPYALGIMEQELGNEEKAREYFTAAITLKPDYPDALKALETLEALETLKQAKDK